MKWARTPPHAGATLRAKSLAGSLRQGLTEPERRLWRAMRQYLPPDGSHFRRQVPLGPYIADFVHLGARLIVEVDGNQHGFDKQRQHDAKRDAYLAEAGFKVLRFSNHDVMTDIMVVIDTICVALGPTPPTPYPSPQGGGESQASRLFDEPAHPSGDPT